MKVMSRLTYARYAAPPRRHSSEWRSKMAEEKKTYICEKCGCEAELVIKERSEQKPKQGTLVCKVCGSEADIILEEV
jgi:transcription elongation factor Elf1